MRMTPALVIVGALLVFWCSVGIAVLLPAFTMTEEKSEIWREWSADERAGHDLYVKNGCSYCHTQFVRNTDQDAQRLAQRGDYVGMKPVILGTERTGPDLSQNGGEHPDDWHIAHFYNPRSTRPMSLMPSWEFLGEKKVRQLTAYMQAMGGTDADRRMSDDPNAPGQRYWKRQAQRAYAAGPDENIHWLHSKVPAPWRPMPNPYHATPAALERGKLIYQRYCINCHGPVGDGQGSATKHLSPPPLNFTTLRGHLVKGEVDGKRYDYIGGIFYYQIMHGITGTAMPYFKRELESEKIWDVSNYIAVYFVGYSDAGLPPSGIGVSYQSPWANPYATPPATQRSSQP